MPGSRHADSILTSTVLVENDSPMVDLSISGQHGYVPDLRTFHANTDYTRRNVYAKLIEAPRGFNYYQNGHKLVQILKSIVEMHALTWEGLTSTLSVDKVSSPVGGAGEQQDTPSKVTRAQSAPVLGLPEKYGLVVQRFFEFWMTELIQDPSLETAGIFTKPGDRPKDHLPDIYTMTVCFFEPDPTGAHVNRAWLCGNMFPEGGVENTGRKDKTAGGDKEDYSIQFSALTQRGRGVDALAQRLLDEMNRSGTSPNNQPAFINQITADVLAAPRGVTEQVNEANRTYIPPVR